jgi:hypothetical protein
MKRYKISNLVPLILATLVSTLAVGVAVQTTQVITTPNAAFVSYNLAPGTISGPITPVASQGVLVMGVQNTVGFRGVGQVTLLRVPGSFLEWVGLESPSSAAITSGFSGTPGTHIVFLDFSHQVDIEVNTTDTFTIHNGSTGQRTGNVTLIW